MSKLMNENKYDEKIWDVYTQENESSTNPSSFIYHLAVALGARKILEVGCNIGNNLTSFPDGFEIHGIDLNDYAINKCKNRFKNFVFENAPATDIPYSDNFFDLVFTRTVFIHIPEQDLKQAMSEVFRVSKKWIFNLEFFKESEQMINWKRGDNLLWHRNMKKRWQEFNVNLISDVDIPLEIDPDKVRLTLVEKRINR